jgi:hypothetical protein
MESTKERPGYLYVKEEMIIFEAMLEIKALDS